ncbi:unnamed protein product [Peniophora sp. CBMAI 1063]|nr:unnamed protein product [Peniophora sp. CBMAI 1063]
MPPAWLEDAGISKEPSTSTDKAQPKKPRHRHSAHQLQLLNELYDRDEHPSLDDRTHLAERLGMEVKTVNAWFQNKRASNKKRNNNKAAATAATGPPLPAAAAPPAPMPVAPPASYQQSLELPPIATLLASTPPPPSATAEQIEIPEYAGQGEYPGPPLLHAEHPSLGYASYGPPPTADPHHQAAFYAGNPQFRHMYDAAQPELASSKPKARSRPSQYQTDEMRSLYARNPHPTREEREELCERIGMRYQSVTNWFQNQRSLAKRRAEAEEDDSRAPSTRASTPAPAPISHGRASRSVSKSHRYSPFPTASEQLPGSALPPSLSHLLHREDSPAPSLAGSVDSSGSRPRRSRPSPQQLTALRRLYRQTATPSIEERNALALEIGMDLAKVTNWFRNLRQTSRKRKARGADDEDGDDSHSSRTHSRSGTPATSFDENDVSMQDVQDRDHDHDEDMHTDEDDADEAPTPGSGASPAPARVEEPWAKGHNVLPPPPVSVPVALKLPSPLPVEHAHEHGVRVEDALLLLSFHQQIAA